MALGYCVEGAAHIGLYGEVPSVDREAVAELVSGFAKELVDVFYEVIVVAGKAAPVFQCRPLRYLATLT
jgi:hypothetical protein